jgi:hypothetical protein
LHTHFGPNEVKHKGKRLYKRNWWCISIDIKLKKEYK